MVVRVFQKDTKGLAFTGKNFGVNLSMVKSVIRSNNDRKLLHTQNIKKILRTIKNKKIAFLGVTFKPNTDDMRGLGAELKYDTIFSQKGES